MHSLVVTIRLNVTGSKVLWGTWKVSVTTRGFLSPAYPWSVMSSVTRTQLILSSHRALDGAGVGVGGEGRAELPLQPRGRSTSLLQSALKSVSKQAAA